MSQIDRFKNLENISFIDNKTLQNVCDEMIADYIIKYKELTGETLELSEASPHRLELYAAAYQIYQAMQYVDRGAKQSILSTSYGEFLDALGVLWGLERTKATSAVTTLRFTVSSPRAFAIAIPVGTRASTDGAVYFATTEYREIPAGSTYVDVPAECTVAGSVGNGFEPGGVSTLVDPIAYIASVTNTDTTSGGSDVESDDDFTERIYLTPSSYSTAGPEEAYEYWVKKFSSDISDVKIASEQTAGEVDIVFLGKDGETPSTSLINALKTYISDKKIRPLTDYVTVAAPAEVPYSIELTYYINSSDSAQVAIIQNNISKAVNDYISWQRKIGRDIIPDKLNALIIAAGAKRVTITSPAYSTVPALSVSVLNGSPSVAYGGLEDD